MPSGPYHYRLAEQMAEQALKAHRDVARTPSTTSDIQMNASVVANLIGLSKVHATLALAAASAQNIRRNGAIERDVADWHEAIGGGS